MLVCCHILGVFKKTLLKVTVGSASKQHLMKCQTVFMWWNIEVPVISGCVSGWVQFDVLHNYISVKMSGNDFFHNTDNMIHLFRFDVEDKEAEDSEVEDDEINGNDTEGMNPV